jgi:hypothetical protein
MEPNSIVLEIDRCCLHHLQNAGKQMVEFGPFRMIRLPSDTNITFITINKFTYCAIADTVVMRAEFEKTVSYFFEYIGGGYYTISFDKEPGQLDNLDGYLKYAFLLT